MRTQRSLLHFAVLIVVAMLTAIFVLKKAHQAIAEIEQLSAPYVNAAR